MMRMVLHTTVTGILKVRTVQPMAVHTQESQARLPIKPAASVKLPVQALGYQLLNQQKAHGHLLPLRLGGQLLNRQMVQLCFQHRLSVDPVLVLGYQLLNQQKPTSTQMQLGLDLSSYKCQNQSKLSSSKVDAPTLQTGMMRMVLHTTVTGILKVRTVQFMAVHTQESQARLPIKPAASVKLPVQAQVDPVPTPLRYQLLNQQKAHGHLLPPRLGGQL